MKSFTALMTLLWIVCIPLAAQMPVQLTSDEQALMEAAHSGRFDEVRRLVVEGTAVDVADPENRTPIMFAAFNGHTEVVAFLLDAGGEVDHKDLNGRTALMYAASGPFGETVELLLENGAEINTQGSLEGFTALMTAAAEGQLEVVRLLLANEADRNLEDKDGDTAETFARQSGHSAVAELLAMGDQ